MTLEEKRERSREYNRKWRERNRESERARHLQYHADNLDKERERKLKYQKDYPAKAAAIAASRRAAKLQRTPIWADKDEIKLIYKQAASLQKLLGTPLHVDHIIPLQGKNVSGLHVADNLQIIGAKANMSKSNTWVA